MQLGEERNRATTWLGGWAALCVFLSQFFVFSSGLPQPANILMLVLIFISFFFLSRDFFVGFKCGFGFFLICFLFWVFLVNGFYSFVWQDWSFHYFTVHILYNFLLFFSVFAAIKRDQKFLDYVCFGVFFSFLFLFLFWVFGVGRYAFFPRYNGFFNDPNQMAFWILCSVAIFFLASRSRFLVKVFVAFLAGALIMSTMSRSALVGLAGMSLGLLLTMSHNQSLEQKGNGGGRKAIFLILSFFVFSIAIYFYLGTESFSSMSQRWSGLEVTDQLDARGYSRLIDYAEYLIFGAGQAMDERFGSIYEIHSTWVGILFYYGVIGILLFAGFLFFCVKGMPVRELLVVSGPMLYGFSTFGARSPIFWIMMAVAASISLSCKKTC
ncbi:MAG: hypothetical protein COB00_03960 [Alcanivorax sp.]|nr:MAG: hypothetical protein COB00_03960 [Alcanivorax sp.]